MRYLSPKCAFVEWTMPRHASVPLVCTPPIASKLGKRPSTPRRGSASVMSSFLCRSGSNTATQVRNYEAVDEHHRHQRRPGARDHLDQRSAGLQEAEAGQIPHGEAVPVAFHEALVRL